MQIYRTTAFTFVIGCVAWKVGGIVNNHHGVQIFLFGYNIFPELVILFLSWLIFRSFFRFDSYDAVGMGIGAGYVFGGIDNSSAKSLAAFASMALGGMLINYLLLTRRSA